MPTLTAIALAALLVGAPPAPAPEGGDPAPPAVLLADFEHEPEVRVSWTTRGGDVVELRGARPYGGDRGRTPMGRNIESFVAVGGTRLSKGAGRPQGAIVRVGFYKAVATRPFFDAIAEDGRVRVVVSGVRFNQPAGALAETVVQHLKFAPEQLEVCSLPTDARDQYNTASPTDTLNGRIRPGEDARLGVLAGGGPGHGTTTITAEPDGSLTLVCEFPYSALRHLQDPWGSGVPGTFVEPIHFHIEFEALPAPVLARVEAGELPWPPPDRMLDESGAGEPARPGADAPSRNGDG